MRPCRIAVAVAAAAIATFTLAGTADAAPPPSSTQTVELPGTNTAGSAGYCPFPVKVVEVSQQKAVKSTTLPDGTTVTSFTGHATATVTNENTNTSLTYNISGPGTVTAHPDGSFAVDAGGPNLFWTTVSNSYSGVPQLSYTTGRLQFSVNKSGKTTSYSLSGNRTDVCAAL